MNIGQAAAASGVSAKMLRYYESIGLIPHAGRSGAGYRTYDEAAVHTLRFIRRARDLGLPVGRIRLLLSLWHDQHRSSADVKRIATEHLAELRVKIAELTGMCDALETLATACHGDHLPECPILEDFGGQGRGQGRKQGDPRGTRHAVAGGHAGAAASSAAP